MFTDPGHDEEEEDFMLYYITCVLYVSVVCTLQRMNVWRIVDVIICHHWMYVLFRRALLEGRRCDVHRRRRHQGRSRTLISVT